MNWAGWGRPFTIIEDPGTKPLPVSVRGVCRRLISCGEQLLMDGSGFEILRGIEADDPSQRISYGDWVGGDTTWS